MHVHTKEMETIVLTKFKSERKMEKGNGEKICPIFSGNSGMKGVERLHNSLFEKRENEGAKRLHNSL
jgi:hypothetical protein